MAKDSQQPKTETAFQRFERLAKKIVNVPKDRLAKRRDKPQQ